MGLKKLIDNYAAFNLWANNHFVTWLQSLDTQLLYQQMPSSFTSIDFTLQHILRTQKYWLAFVCEKDTSTFSWAVFENEVERILEELNTQSEEMHNTISSFSEEQLLTKLILDSPSSIYLQIASTFVLTTLFTKPVPTLSATGF